jgi:glycosyltransferase involved in cell wall biosynthesis
MEVVYSIGAEVPGMGIGTTAYEQVRGLVRHGALKTLFVGSGSGGVARARTRRLGPLGRTATSVASRLLARPSYYLWKDRIFDRSVARRLPRCDLVHAWGDMALATFRKAHARGAKCVMNAASNHPDVQAEILAEEYARLGLKVAPPIHPESAERLRREFDAADAIFPSSPWVRDNLLRLGFEGSRLHLNPWGVDLERFRPAPKSDDVFRVTFVGSIGPRKGVQYLLRAWEMLKLRDPVELRLYGRVTTDFEPIMARYADDPRIVVGFGDPVEAYRQASVFVFPSLEEGSALVTYEAMASGRASVVSDHSGSPVRSGRDGFVVRAGDAEAIAEHVSLLYEDPELRAAMGRSAREHIEGFSWDAHGDRLVDIYRKVLRPQ